MPPFGNVRRLRALAEHAAFVEFGQPLARELAADRAKTALAEAEREHRKASKYWPGIMDKAARAHDENHSRRR